MLSKLYHDKFVRHNAIVLVGSFTAAFLNYLVHPVLGRLMTVQEFGEFQALLQIYNNLMFMGVFGTIVMNITANTDPTDEQAAQENREVISVLNKVALVISSTVALAILLGSGLLRDFFHFDSIWPFVMLVPAPIIAMHGVFRRAYLRAKLHFTDWTMSSVYTALARLFIAAVLVFIGWGAFGAITGVVGAMFVGYAFVYLRSRKTFSYVRGVKIKLSPRLKREIQYGFLILSVSLVNTAMSTADVLVVKRYFDPIIAGEYSAVATIARIILYAAGPVAIVLSPNIKLRQSVQENRAVLRKSIWLMSFVAGSGLLIFVLWPEFVLKLLMGSQFNQAAYLLPHLAIFMTLVTMSGIFFAYHLALRHYFIFLVGLAGLGTALALSVVYHPSLSAIVNNFIAGTVLMLLIFAVRWIRRLFFFPNNVTVE
ncbi:MAG: oligosaccharide flippase family protein [Patescibacteria group bacterium]